MVPARPGRAPLLRSTFFALVLAIGTVAGAVGRDAATDAPLTTAAADVALSRAVVAATLSVPRTIEAPTPLSDRAHVRPATPALDRTTRYAPTPRLHQIQAAKSGSPARGGAVARGAGGYHGRNHVWMPSLGIDKQISFYACSNASYPGNRVYRWGCGGRNNVYLFGHASSVFKSLHDAYLHGRLRKGAPLYYADASGGVHAYEVSWWKLTTATKGTWAYASQSKPSLTLQTCIGAKSQYRLIVRLTEVD